MTADNKNYWLSVEYFCSKTGNIWRMKDAQLIKFAAQELCQMGFIATDDLLDGVVLRMEKAYPAYFGSYKQLALLRNYFGGYLSLMILIFSQRPSFMLLSLLCVLVSFSPSSILIWLYLFIRKYILKGDYGWVIILSIGSFLTFISIFTFDISIVKFFFGDSETSSFWERLEFIRSSYKMWSDNTLIS